jgi:hypothetical protein
LSGAQTREASSRVVLEAVPSCLHSRLSPHNVNLLLGGGFGLFLKQLDIMMGEARTLLPVETWPTPRTTNDLDLFVPIELLVNLENMQTVRSVLDDLEFKPVGGSEYWQFGLASTDVKIDLLTGPIPPNAEPGLKLDSGDNRRVRPVGNLKLHARRTPEALGLEENQEEIIVQGKLSNGSEYSGIVRIPSPFTYLMMKLTAFGDQVNSEQKVFGRHHALDIYRIIAMLTEEQFERTRQLFSENSQEERAQRAITLAETMFVSNESAGIVRMREHAFFGPKMDISAFIDGLRGLIGRDPS